MFFVTLTVTYSSIFIYCHLIQFLYELGGARHGTNLVIFQVYFLILLGFYVTATTAAKRYHDMGKTALWAYLFLIPHIGIIWVFIECCFRRGEQKENVYGPVDQRSFLIA